MKFVFQGEIFLHLISLDRDLGWRGSLSAIHEAFALSESCSGRLASSQTVDSTASSIGGVYSFGALVVRAVCDKLKVNDVGGRVVTSTGCECRSFQSGNELSLNKCVKLVRFAHWTVAPRRASRLHRRYAEKEI